MRHPGVTAQEAKPGVSPDLIMPGSDMGTVENVRAEVGSDGSQLYRPYWPAGAQGHIEKNRS